MKHVSILREVSFKIDSVSVCEETRFVLPPFFSDHMILQAEKPIRLWGQYPMDGGIAVRITDTQGVTQVFGGRIQDRHFEVWIPAFAYGGPYTVELIAEHGGIHVIRDVLFGDVFLFGGQSNMALWIKDCHVETMEKLLYQDLIDTSANDEIRSFTVYPYDAENPQVELHEHELQIWRSAMPETLPEFAAVPYFFCREMHRRYGRPVAMIVASVGATAIQCWIPPEEFKKFGLTQDALQTIAEETVNYAPSRYYNGMIYPLARMELSGILWYQGEGNMAGFNSAKKLIYQGYHRYGDYLKEVIEGWRRTFEEPKLPVAVVQLPRFVEEGTYFWAREEDKRACSLVEHATYSVNIDNGLYPENVVPGDPINEGHGIHPYEKHIVGERLAQVYMKQFLQEPGILSGPVLCEARLFERKVLLRFENVGEGLCIDGEPAGFEIADANGQFYAATPVLMDKDQVLVGVDGVLNPLAIRYGFSNKSPLITEPLLSCRQSVCLYNTLTKGGEAAYPAEQFWVNLYKA